MVALDQSLRVRAMFQGAAVARPEGLTIAPICAKGLRSGSASAPCGRGEVGLVGVPAHRAVGGRYCRNPRRRAGGRSSFRLNLSVRPRRVPRRSSRAARISAPGRRPSQLFASDCSGCHRAAQGLAKNRSATGLGEFMREHYTNSRESAFALANYLNRCAMPHPRRARRRPRRQPHRRALPTTASVPRPPGSIPGEGDTPPGDTPKPVVEQPPRPTPGTAASKRGQRGAPAQAAARLPPPEPPPPPKPEVPEIFD